MTFVGLNCGDGKDHFSGIVFLNVFKHLDASNTVRHLSNLELFSRIIMTYEMKFTGIFYCVILSLASSIL